MTKEEILEKVKFHAVLRDLVKTLKMNITQKLNNFKITMINLRQSLTLLMFRTICIIF